MPSVTSSSQLIIKITMLITCVKVDLESAITVGITFSATQAIFTERLSLNSLC